jgi:hypothetical protein
MADIWLEPYEEALGEYPVTGSVTDRFKAALRFALQAPSVHNTQPWRCRIRASELEIRADRTRALVVSDPDGRELLMSCGALIEHVTIALARFGQIHRLAILPNGATRDPVARFGLGPVGRPDPDAVRLFAAIPNRRTNRKRFAPTLVPSAILARATTQARTLGAKLEIVDRRSRGDLIDLIAEADRVQMADPRFRRELGRWLRTPGSRKRDGIPAANGKAPLVASPMTPLVVRTFDLGTGVAAHDRKIAVGSPVLALLTTDADDQAAWVAAGRALARVLLQLTSSGVDASFLNQPVEVPEIRARLNASFASGRHCQAILRLGYAKPVPATPRRPVTEIV